MYVTPPLPPCGPWSAPLGPIPTPHQVRRHELPQGAGSRDITTRKLAQHDGRAHRLCLDPLNPSACFYSCGEDGAVRGPTGRALAPENGRWHNPGGPRHQGWAHGEAAVEGSAAPRSPRFTSVYRPHACTPPLPMLGPLYPAPAAAR
jgi:hypothetical protein